MGRSCHGRLPGEAARHSGRSSRFPGSFAARLRKQPRLVHARVCGIIFTPKRFCATSLTVRLTPSSATEPFGAIKGISSSGASKTNRTNSASGRRSTIRAMPSTWPKTRCPPSSSPSRSDFSRLTGVPSCQSPRVVQRQSLDRRLHRECSGFDCNHRQARSRAGDRGPERDRRGVKGRSDRQIEKFAAAQPPHPSHIGDDPGKHADKLRVYPAIYQGLLRLDRIPGRREETVKKPHTGPQKQPLRLL